MPIATLPRKFTHPQLPSLHIPRPHLIARLAAGLHDNKRLTLLSGGPGTGKTVLLAEYCLGTRHRYAWFGLGGADLDPVVFGQNLIDCVLNAVPACAGASRETLGSLGGKGLAQALSTLCDDLGNVLVEPLILVIDDLHRLTSQSGEPPGLDHPGLEALVRDAPDALQIVLSSRGAPPLKLANLKLHDQIVALGEDDLRFSADEISRYLNLTCPESPSPEIAQSVNQRTRGWVIGVVHAASGGAKVALARMEQPEFLYDYLAEEFLGGLPTAFREDLVACSALPRLDRANCRALVGAERAGALMDDLAAHALVGTRTDDAFELHPIFREFLFRELLVRWSPNQRVAHFRILAAEVAETPAETVNFLLLGEDWGGAEAVLRESASELLRTGLLVTLRRLIEQFPTSFRKKSAWLAFLTGELKRREGDLAVAIEILGNAEQMATHEGDTVGQGWIVASLGAAFGARGMAELQRKHAERALALLPESCKAGVALATNTLGLYYLYRSEQVDAERAFNRALGLYQQEQDAAGEIRVLNNLGLLHANSGSYVQAISYYEASIRSAEASSRLPLPVSLNNLALALHYLGRSGDAAKALARGMALAEQTGANRDRVHLLRTTGQFAMDQGNCPQAKEYFDTSLAEAMQLGDKHSQVLGQLRLAELALQQQKCQEAISLIGSALAIAGRSIEDPEMIEAATVQAEAWLQARRNDEASALLDRIAAFRESSPHHYHSMLVAQLRYRLACDRNDRPGAEQQAAIIRETCGRRGFPLPRWLLPPGSATVVPTATPPGLEVRTMGSFDVKVEGVLVAQKSWRTAYAKVVLVYLLLTPDGATKETLRDLLYPDREPNRSAVSTVICRLRQALEPKCETSRYILFQEGRYILNCGVLAEIDVKKFRHLVVAARDRELDGAHRRSLLEQAVSKYRGEFLAEFTEVSWCQIEREKLRRLAAEAYEVLFGLAAADDDWARLEDLADAQLAHDTADEVALRSKIVALAMQERTRDALRAGEMVTEQIGHQLGLALEQDTIRLLEALRSDRFTVKLARELLPDPS